MSFLMLPWDAVKILCCFCAIFYVCVLSAYLDWRISEGRSKLQTPPFILALIYSLFPPWSWASPLACITSLRRLVKRVCWAFPPGLLYSKSEWVLEVWTSTRRFWQVFRWHCMLLVEGPHFDNQLLWIIKCGDVTCSQAWSEFGLGELEQECPCGIYFCLSQQKTYTWIFCLSSHTSVIRVLLLFWLRLRS